MVFRFDRAHFDNIASGTLDELERRQRRADAEYFRPRMRMHPVDVRQCEERPSEGSVAANAQPDVSTSPPDAGGRDGAAAGAKPRQARAAGAVKRPASPRGKCQQRPSGRRAAQEVTASASLLAPRLGKLGAAVSDITHPADPCDQGFADLMTLATYLLATTCRQQEARIKQKGVAALKVIRLTASRMAARGDFARADEIEAKLDTIAADMTSTFGGSADASA